jgi:hypothetical protein
VVSATVLKKSNGVTKLDDSLLTMAGEESENQIRPFTHGLLSEAARQAISDYLWRILDRRHFGGTWPNADGLVWGA